MRVLDEVNLDLAMYGFAMVMYTDNSKEFSIKRETQRMMPDARDVDLKVRY